jgi:hypothetical protein
VSNIFASGHWVIFAAVGVLASYGMRLLAWAGTRQGAARIAAVRRELSLPAQSTPAPERSAARRARTR